MTITFAIDRIAPRAAGLRAARTRPDAARAQEAGVGREFIERVYRFAPNCHLALASLALLSAPLLYATLELPKWIINGALAGIDGQPAPMLGCLPPETALIALSMLQLAALGALSGLKYAANLMSANLGERLLRRMRLQVLRRWRRTPAAERDRAVAPMLTQELEAVAGFAGGMVAIPIAQGAAFLTVMIFLIAQDWRLALAAIALTPLQAFLVPYLLRAIGELKQERIAVVRSMCAQLSDGSDAEFASALRDARRAQELRFDIHRRKFLMKAAYNMIGHLTPLSYLSIGGWLVLSGELSLGALVAALAAYREAAGPLRELFAYYMRWSDARIRYRALRGALA